MTSYPYDGSRNPPFPVVELTISRPDGVGPVESVRLLADSGADQTLLPDGIAQRLGLVPEDTVAVGGFSGSWVYLDEYEAHLSLGGLPAVSVRVLGGSPGFHSVVGRDVLNRFKIILDGPNQTLEIP